MPRRPLIEKVLDIVVYAPVGLALQIRDDVPALVENGRTRVSERVQVARWIGEMAVTYGRRELEKRMAEVAAEKANPPALTVVPSVPSPTALATGVSSPPFEGYASLAAAQVVQLLGRLPAADLELIRDYESAHRGRRTILSKLDQLLGTG
jgi:hypothetical protein